MAGKTMEECAGYKSLLAAVEKDEGSDHSRHAHNYRGKLQWVVDRANHYAEKTGLDAADILDAWESKRSYWYMNFYQEASQPKIEGDAVRVFDTTEDLLASIGSMGFRCPYCKGVSRSPYKCDSGVELELLESGAPKTGVCNWKVYGLFGHLGRGIYVFVKSELKGENVFMPIAWEESTEPALCETS
jgi:hypothetical protein